MHTWVEQSQGLMQRSTVSFLVVTYSVLPCLSIIFQFAFSSCPLLFLAIYSVHAGYLFCNRDSLNTTYYGTTFGGVPGSFNSDQIECMCRQNRHRVQQRDTSPLSKGITQLPTEMAFSAITNCASTISLAQTWLLWPPRHLSEGNDSCTRSC